MRKKFIIANWKENPATEGEALRLFGETAKAKRARGVEVVVCPPVVYLESVVKKMRGLKLKQRLAVGAQDVFWQDEGPFTSEVGPRMLKSFGVQYVIVGHSERRKLLHETDLMVSRKVRAALAGGLSVILCVGEPLSVRKKGIVAAKKFIKNQLTKDLQDLNSKSRNLEISKSGFLIAYEPLWAIGSGNNDTPRDASEMAIFIKKNLRPRPYALDPAVLYGGSVTGANVLDYVQSKGIDGALVGGASLKAGEMRKMIEEAGKR